MGSSTKENNPRQTTLSSPFGTILTRHRIARTFGTHSTYEAARHVCNCGRCYSSCPPSFRVKESFKLSDVKDQTIALNVRLKPETSVWFIELVWFNQINETDQIDRTDQMNKIGWRTFTVSC